MTEQKEFERQFLNNYEPDNSFDALLKFVRNSSSKTVASNLYNSIHTVEARDKEIIQLKNRIAELKSLCKECADHFDIYRYSDIVFDFTLREKLRKQVKK